MLVTYPRDLRYLTGFRGDDSVMLVTPSKLWIVSDSRYEEELQPFKKTATIVMRQGAMTEALSKLLKSVGPKKLGIQAEHMTVAFKAALAKGAGEKRLRDTSAVIKSLRAVKDAGEIALLRNAVKLQEAALNDVLRTIKPGQAESDIAARLEMTMRIRGAESVSFPSIVAAGANGSLPHAVPGAAKVKKDSTLLIDWGACVGGYRADMTRTFAIGKWPKKMAEVYRVVLDAHLAAIAAIKPGKTGKEIDAVARGIISKAGFGEFFGHGLGHGIGLDIHEDPGLNKLTEPVLKPGMVVTVEPGIYLPGVGGVRIEDDVLVTDRGGTSLCSMPKTLDWATR